MSKYQMRNGKVVTRKEMLQIMNWCKKKLGSSKYNSMKHLKLRVDSRLEYLGMFDNNTIYVNVSEHKNKIELAETIIHEYVHFRQSSREYNRLWRKNYWKYRADYFAHPYEKEAETKALKFARPCLKELKIKMR